MPVALSAWSAAAVVLAPAILVYFTRPGPLAVLLATPLAVFTLILAAPLLYLAASLFLDRQWSLRSPAQTPWQDDAAALKAVPRLSFLTPAAWSAQCTRLAWARNSDTIQWAPIHPTSDSVSQAVNELIHLTLRDFVEKWHTPLASGSQHPTVAESAPEFPQAVEATVRHALTQLAGMASRVDIATLTVRKILPQLTHHLDAFRKAEASMRGSSETSALHTLGSEQVDLFLAGKYEGGKLHRAVGDMSSPNTRVAEQAFLRSLVSRLLPAVLPAAELQSQAVMAVVRELVACTVLYPVVDMMSDPDFWNNLLDQKAGAVMHEQKLVSKLREALDKQDASPPGSTHHAGIDLWPQTKARKKDQRSFETFMQSISDTTSILEARRTKNDIAMQIRKTKATLEQLQGADMENKRAQLQIYVQRLEAAHSLVEKKVAELGSGKALAASRGTAGAGADPTAARATLRDVLLNPSSLSFFMEAMDRRQRLILVQFWLIVESFKNPLEEVGSADEDEDWRSSSSAKTQAPSPQMIKTLREDLELFDQSYYSSPLIRVNPKHVENARAFLRESRSSQPTAQQVVGVRRSVLMAQRQVYREMEEDDWPAFKRSDLFLKAIQDLTPGPDLSAGLASSVASLGPAQAMGPLSQADAYTGSPRARASSATSSDRKLGLAAHADLFGAEDGAELSSDRTRQRNALFDEKPAAARTKSSAMAGNLDILIGGRTQYVGSDGRAPLFRNDPLFDDFDEEGSERNSSPGSEYVQVDKVDAIQSALASIIDEDMQSPRISGSSDSLEKLGRQRHAGTRAKGRNKGPTRFQTPDRGASAASGRGAIFADEDDAEESFSGPENEISAASLVDQSQQQQPGTTSGVPFAAPGDLNLDGEITRMEEKLEKLQSQEEILDALIRKAELTGARAGELRLLQKSRNAVRREAREVQWQRDQFELQRSENKLVAGQTQVGITGTTIALDTEGKEYAVYLIEVNLVRETTAAVTSGWIVGRRYSEFWALHQSLKEKLTEVRALESEFPGKRLVGLVHAPFVDARKSSLERYLQALVKLPSACESTELRAFLSQSPTGTLTTNVVGRAGDQSRPTREGFGGVGAGFPGRGFVKSLFKGMTGVAEGLDDLIGIGPSMLDIVVQRLSTQIQGTSQGGRALSGIPDIDLVSQAMDQRATPAELKEAAGAGTTYWTEPICDLFVEIFELKEKNNWLRRQAIVILLQQLFGSTIERKVRDVVANSLRPDPLVGYISALKNGMWPGGELKQPTPPRTLEEKEALRESANRKLSTLVPELAANLIGRENARRGSRRVFTALQNKRLNKHLVYTVLEMTIDEMLR